MPTRQPRTRSSVPTLITAAVLATPVLAASALAAGGPEGGDSDPRNVQFQTIDFTAGTITLVNFDDQTIDLTGWRFCSHDFDQERQYSGAGGLSGVMIEAGTTLTVHLNNDAPAGDPDAINRSSVGGAFAAPLDQDAFGMQIFRPGSNGLVQFSNSDLIADHIQWNLDAAAPGLSQERSGQAVATGLWTAADAFIVTTMDSERIDLTDLTGGLLHGPANYDVTEPVSVPVVHDESVDGDLSSDPDAPTALGFELGANRIIGSVTSIAPGDRDFITFVVPGGRELSMLQVVAWSPADIGFVAVNAGATGFVPSPGTNGEFLAGIHVGAANVGTDIMPNFVSDSLTNNSLPEPRLGPGTYTLVVQQASPVLSAYTFDFVLAEIACPGDIDRDGSVGFGDVLAVLAAFGPCGNQCEADADGNGSVGFGDLLIVLSAFGACP
ncbi:MAG: hypothetical protein AB8G96_14235 [Phycisphaerales bacterium]